MKRSGLTLRKPAQKRGVYFGCAVGRAFWTDAKYRELLAGQCGVIVAENVMKWAHIHPRRHEYDWKAADDLVAFARSKRMRMRGHTLVWHHQAPAWLEYETRNPDALASCLAAVR